MITKEFYQKYFKLLKTAVVMQDQDSPFLDGPYAMLETNKIENVDELLSDLNKINYSLGTLYGCCVAFKEDDLNAISIDIKDIEKIDSVEFISADDYCENNTSMYEEEEDCEDQINERLEELGYSDSLSDFPFLEENVFVDFCDLKI